MSVNEKLRSAQHDELFEGILQLQTVEECYAFFEDICTVNELKALSQRLQVAKMLRAGDSYETIVEETGASTATIMFLNVQNVETKWLYVKTIEQLRNYSDSAK